MTPHKQRNLHRPEEGIKGDCWRTALACLLDLEPEEVPHFYGSTDVDAEVNAMTDAFLAPRGLRIVTTVLPGDLSMESALHWVGTLNPGLHCLFSGTSRNGTNHVVIARDGAIVHDTALDDAGIVGPVDTGWWWIQFLGARV